MSPAHGCGEPDEASAVELVGFVRETLGCGCPAEVLARISVERSESGELGLDVGGRLLVRVVWAESLDRLIREFPDLLDRALEERDRRGFNRARLVVIDPRPETVEEALRQMVEVVAPSDGRVHVHVLPATALPAALDLAG